MLNFCSGLLNRQLTQRSVLFCRCEITISEIIDIKGLICFSINNGERRKRFPYNVPKTAACRKNKKNNTQENMTR